MQRQVGGDAFDAHFAKRAPHAHDRLLARRRMDDELGDQGIVMRRNAITRRHMGIDPHAGAARQVKMGDEAWAGNEVVRVLGIDAALDRMSLADNVFLRNFKRMTESDEKLLAHQIHPEVISVTGCSTCRRVFISMK